MRRVTLVLLSLLLGYVAGMLVVTVYADEGLYCYNPYGRPVIAEHYADTVRLKVNWLFDDRGEVAWSEWDIAEDNTVDCEIWVHRPEQPLGDPDMDALGHEVLHCLIGDFHD